MVTLGRLSRVDRVSGCAGLVGTRQKSGGCGNGSPRLTSTRDTVLRALWLTHSILTTHPYIYIYIWKLWQKRLQRISKVTELVSGCPTAASPERQTRCIHLGGQAPRALKMEEEKGAGIYFRWRRLAMEAQCRTQSGQLCLGGRYGNPEMGGEGLARGGQVRT